MVHFTRSLVLIVWLSVSLAACGTDSSSTTSTDGGGGVGDTGTSDAGTSDAGPSDTQATAGDVAGSPDPSATVVDLQKSAAQEAYAKALAKVLTEAQTLELPAFMATYTAKQAPTAQSKLGYDALKATYMDVITKELKPNAAEQALLSKNGFVVSERWNHPTMAEALLKVYKMDLPVLVTTDMILQALHASYDDILKTLEREVLVTGIGTALKKAHDALKVHDLGAAAGKDAFADQVRGDVDIFLTVARSLLAGTVVASVGGPSADAEVATLLALVKAEKMVTTTLFGSQRKMDFSQFKPRGHYEGDPVLERYFRAMIWLGRADLRLMEPDTAGATAKWIWRPRQVAAALVLWQLTDKSGAMPHWQQANDLITLLVGPVDYIDFSGVQQLAADGTWTVATDIPATAPSDLKTLQGKLIAGAYGSQQIASHWLATNPHSSEVTPLPPSFAFLGQRFVVDSHVMSNVVYDRIVHKGVKVKRVLPSPLDVAFALGNDHAATHLQAEMAKFPYYGALHTVRWLVDSYSPQFWQDNVYNLWLSALRTLTAPTTDKSFPSAMHTVAWHDKSLRTQLASWAQLRHDTILYAKQSYTGGVACEHPDGFVEPYPAFYGKLADLADVTSQALLNAPFDNTYVKTNIEKFFVNWKAQMLTLQAIAAKELKGEQLSATDVDFLKKTIVTSPGCGAPIFSGWYVGLYFQADNFDKYRPTIADVHTNPNSGPLPGPNVLHVATSSVDLMVFTSDTCNGAEAFVGPVFRYHEVDVKAIKRLSDKDWEAMLKDGSAPGQPAWTTSFVAPK